ncbi:hypothetical protein BBP40_007927 [Aspergillus hancockii]|nr:hypothetical protein BBP40_007927 [Aspergillus hancockii]
MEDSKSESEWGVGMQCSLAQTQGTIRTTFDSSELPIYYFDESRFYESPESDWQGTTTVRSLHVSSVNPTCIPEESVDVAKPQRDQGNVMDSALAQTVGAARAASGSPELPIQEPEVPARVEVSVQTDTPLWEEKIRGCKHANYSRDSGAE